MIRGVDFAFTHPDPAGLYELGFRFAGRYIGPGTDDKHIHADEIAELNGAGLAIVSLVEGRANSAIQGYLTGVVHGQEAQAGVDLLGIPQDRPMYAAIDWDFQDSDRQAVAHYLAGLASVIGQERVGVYGGIRAVQWAHEVVGVRWLFQTYAWSHGAWYPAAQLRQTLNGQEAAGGQVDLCVATVDDYGGWSIVDPAGPQPGGNDMTPEQAAQLAEIHERILNINTSLYVKTGTGGIPEIPAPDRWGQDGTSAALVDYIREIYRRESITPADLAQLAQLIQQLLDRPLVDAVAVAEAIRARPEIAAAIAQDVAAQLGTLTGSLSLSGQLSGRVGPS